jgi:hypothetical protein
MLAEEKVCIGCGLTKSVDDFYMKASGKGRRSQCIVCNKATAAVWAKENKDQVNERNKGYRKSDPERYARYDLRASAKKLGLDPDVIEAHFLSHNGLCDSCDRPPEESIQPKERLSIDHDHETGKFRGLLCADCNLIIGWAHDDVKQLLGAVAYLERSWS